MYVAVTNDMRMSAFVLSRYMNANLCVFSEKGAWCRYGGLYCVNIEEVAIQFLAMSLICHVKCQKRFGRSNAGSLCTKYNA